LLPYDSAVAAKKTAAKAKDGKAGDKHITKVKETSPVFHQFLDATYQLLYQYPTRFEFNERFLRRLLYHLYSCQYGTFLYDNEKERVEAGVKDRTRSVWDYFLSRKEQFLNDKYDGAIDDNARGHERLIFPRLSEVRWWSEVFGRTDAEMNGSTHNTHVGVSVGTGTGVVTGVETAYKALGAGAPGKAVSDASSVSNSRPSSIGGLGAGLSALNLGKGKGGASGRKSPVQVKSDMEVEMQ